MADVDRSAAFYQRLFDSRVLLDVLLAFIVFCMGASSIYLINDARDVEADRAHPTKRFRPIAAGVLPVGLAYAIAVVLGVVAGMARIRPIAEAMRRPVAM